jgi:hypothetical protein
VLLQFLRGRPPSASQETLAWLFRLVVLADDDPASVRGGVDPPPTAGSGNPVGIRD